MQNLTMQPQNGIKEEQNPSEKAANNETVCKDGGCTDSGSAKPTGAPEKPGNTELLFDFFLITFTHVAV